VNAKFYDVVVKPRLRIACPDNDAVTNDEGLCGALYTVPQPTVTLACDVVTLDYRYRPVDEFGDNIDGEGWSDWTMDAASFLDVGYWKIQWRATDGINTRRCTFLVTVTDDEKPKYNMSTPDVELYTEDGADCPNPGDPAANISLERNRDVPLTVGNVPVPYTVAGVEFMTPTAAMTDNCTAPEDIEVYVWNVQLDYDGNGHALLPTDPGDLPHRG
jgi:hypothetical protein